jgi:hypothetical protein
VSAGKGHPRAGWRPTATDRMEGMTADDTRISVGDLRPLVPDFQRALKAANKSPKTVGIYADAARRMIDVSSPTGCRRRRPR